jgi:hypothetical protein
MAWCIELLFFLPVAWCATPGHAQSQAQAEAVLDNEFGLVRQGKEAWILPREVELRQRLDSLPELLDQMRKAHISINEARELNLARLPQRQAEEQALKKKAAKFGSTDPKRKQIEEEIKALDRVAVAPEKLGGAPVVQQQLIHLISARGTALLGVSAARRDASALSDEYRPLLENEDVRAALRQLGGEHRLGPLRDYASDVRSLDAVEQFVFAQPQPLYLQSGRLRLGAILGERIPVTFSWSPKNEPTLITANIAQAAGIQPDASAPQTTVACPGGRSFAARRVVLESLRFGKHMLRDVEAFVLPPEGEDCGARISPAAFKGYRVVAEPALLHFRIEPAQ